MKAAGQLSNSEEAAGKIPKNVITRSLGPYADCKVDLEGPLPLEVGDIFLLCSDGLSGMVRTRKSALSWPACHPKKRPECSLIWPTCAAAPTTQL